MSIDTNAVQRHRNIILDCLRDGDISIRRRALELSYALINDSNVRILVRELLAFLEVADDEFKLGMTTQISLAAERFAPNKRWHIDTVLRVLKLVRAFVIPISFIHLYSLRIRLATSSEKKSFPPSYAWLHTPLSCRHTPRQNSTPPSAPIYPRNRSRCLQRGYLASTARCYSRVVWSTRTSLSRYMTSPLLKRLFSIQFSDHRR